MTVKELIEYLQTLPEGLQIFTKGNEFDNLYPLKKEYIYKTMVFYNPKLTFPCSHYYEIDKDLDEDPGEYKEKFIGLVIR
jgi:hypothetical protein